MRLIFIRHAEPDYSIDSLTEKGWREAELLSERVTKWENITKYYVSPLGRANATCYTSLDKMGIKAETLDWLKEFCIPTYNPANGVTSVPWDFYPEYWTNDPVFMNKDTWTEAEIYKDVNIKEEADIVINSFDSLLKDYGYVRNKNMYLTDKENDDTTLVFFCHLGVSFLIISHLLNISPSIMWHSFFVAPSSVTILASEERDKGKASFRIQTLGDTSHLRLKNEPVSSSGYFSDVFSD